MIADWHTKEGYLIFFFTFFTTKILTIIFVDFYKKISLVQSKIWEPPIFCTQRTSENIHPKYFFCGIPPKKNLMLLYDPVWLVCKRGIFNFFLLFSLLPFWFFNGWCKAWSYFLWSSMWWKFQWSLLKSIAHLYIWSVTKALLKGNEWINV